MKPCPFCGSDKLADGDIYNSDGSLSSWVECRKCGARGPDGNDGREVWEIRSAEAWKHLEETGELLEKEIK